jgi:hypothetical protein
VNTQQETITSSYPFPSGPFVIMILNCLDCAARSRSAVTTRELPWASTVHPSWTKEWPISAIFDLLASDMPAKFSPRRINSSLQASNSYTEQGSQQ